MAPSPESSLGKVLPSQLLLMSDEGHFESLWVVNSVDISHSYFDSHSRSKWFDYKSLWFARCSDH